MRSTLGNDLTFFPKNASTEFQIDGITYDTKEIVIDFFKKL